MILSHHRGLVVAEHEASEDAVQRALREHDDYLTLSKEFDPQHKTWVYVVVRRMGGDRPAAHICDWRDDHGVPLPLTHRLVDKVNALRMGSRAPQVDPEAANDKIREAAQREFSEYVEERTAGWETYARWGPKTVTPAGPALAAARRRERRKGFNV